MEQAQKLTLSSRAFYNSVFGRFAETVTKMFGYDMVLPMNTGAEAVETAIKLARKWAYMKKGVKQGQAVILSAKDNFHGRTLGVIRYVKLVICAFYLSLIEIRQHEHGPRQSTRLRTVLGGCRPDVHG